MLKATTNKEISLVLNTQLKPYKFISENSFRMKQENPKQPTSIFFAIGTALLLHIFLLLALSHLPIVTKEELLRTVPTVTITAGSIASTDSQQSQIQSANTVAANAYLATLKASTFQVQQEQKLNRERSAQRKQTSTSQAKTQNQTEKPPTKSLTRQSQTSRAQRANQGMMNIFKQKKITGETTQISTKEHKELSDYELSLRSILSRAVLYDQFHKFIRAKNDNEINFEVTLILHPSGAIKNAVISRSSGIKEIDTLAKQNAFKASPYPRPPAEDMQNGFRYAISITHQKVNQNN